MRPGGCSVAVLQWTRAGVKPKVGTNSPTQTASQSGQDDSGHMLGQKK